MYLNPKRLMIIIGSLAVLGGAIYFSQNYSEKKEQEGRSSLYQIQKTFEAETKAIPETERNSGTLDVDAKYPKTISELNGLVNSKKGTDHTLFEANFRLGNLYFQNQQAKKAEDAFNAALKYANGAFQKSTCLLMVGLSSEKSDQFKQAIDLYTQGLSKGFDGLKPEFLLGLVRNHLKLNEKEKAKLYSEKLTTEYSGSREAMSAQELVK